MKFFNKYSIITFGFMFSFVSEGQKTEILYLSETGSDNPVMWQFFCTDDR